MMRNASEFTLRGFRQRHATTHGTLVAPAAVSHENDFSAERSNRCRWIPIGVDECERGR
jgi:hypothetical protein